MIYPPSQEFIDSQRYQESKRKPWPKADHYDLDEPLDRSPEPRICRVERAIKDITWWIPLDDFGKHSP